ncbi:unnamed protein product [Fusarium venenatum]|uniref:Uncharacterized protein n=1 Tax=Fusarium venenatum TaxID=56646 RepID=A0A2L2TUC9_9HYPO|nr:uncharacterized protein FVRRES_00327 [Fusarium venenatum]CEI63815.1 unnamed protein product [Fusarium venenatum]
MQRTLGIQFKPKSNSITSVFPAPATYRALDEPTPVRIKAPAKLPNTSDIRNPTRRSRERFRIFNKLGSITRSTHAAVAIAVVISWIRKGLMEATWAPDAKASNDNEPIDEGLLPD